MRLFTMIASLLVVCGLTAASAGAQSSPGQISSPNPLSGGGPALNSPDNPYLGSATSEKLHPGVLYLSLQNALTRGLQANLGLFLSSTAEDKSRAARWIAMSALLPHLEGSLRESTQRINLRALGIPLATLPRTVDVSNSDARLELSQSLLDLPAISRTRAATSSQDAARSSYRDARETVVTVISGEYLAVLSAQSRVDLAQADLATAAALYQLARDRETSGLSPEVDTLRAQVEWQARQEREIEAGNALAKQRIVLLRLLGLDVHQSIVLTTSPAAGAATTMTSETALQQALASRHDYRSVRERLRSAEQAKQAAELERAPKLGIAANYGALGTDPGNAIPTWNLGVSLRVPIFEGGRIRSEVSDADVTVRQLQAKVEDIRARIEQEVENSLLDLEATKKQVDVAHSALGYANRALTQSRDRFSAGVTNNIEVIQAQEALASANEQWINSLYAYNVAKVSLARATGSAETSVANLFASSPEDKVDGIRSK